MRAYNVWVTRRCNLNCKYCYEGNDKRAGDFKEENIKDLLDFILSHSREENKIHINFHGGEPLLRMDFIRTICKELNRNGKPFFYSLTTNGTLLDGDKIEFIKRNNIYLSLSLDGNQVAHDLNRVDHAGRGSYETVISNIQNVLEQGIVPRVRMTVCPNTVPYLYDCVQHLAELNFCNIVAAPDLYDKTWNDNILKSLEKQLWKIFDSIDRSKVSFSFLDDNIHVKKGRCMGGETECSIDVDTTIYPCTMAVDHPELNIGNLKSGIQESKLLKLKEINNMSNQECMGCTYYPYCISSRCKILNKQMTGDFLSASGLLCALEHIMYHFYNESLPQNK